MTEVEEGRLCEDLRPQRETDRSDIKHTQE